MKEKKSTNEYVVFGIGNEFYCVEIKKLERILLNDYIRFVPNAPSIIEGVVHNEEKIIPIINLKKKFKLNISRRVDSDSYIIIFKQNEYFLGFSVDYIYESLETDKSIREENSYIPDNVAPFAKGTLTFEKDNEQEIMIVLDLSKINI